MKKVTIIGATGSLGRAVTKRLTEEKVELTLVSRSITDSLAPKGARVLAGNNGCSHCRRGSAGCRCSICCVKWQSSSNGKHNKKYLRYSLRYLVVEAGLLVAGLALSLWFADNLTTVVVIATVMLFAMESHFVHFYITQTAKHHKVDWYWV